MDRLRRFIGEAVVAERLSDSGARGDLGVKDRWMPDEIEAFDEIELSLPLDDERDAVLTLALEDGKLARIMLSWAKAGDDDADTVGFSEEDLGSTLDRHGETLVRLLDFLTGS